MRIIQLSINYYRFLKIIIISPLVDSGKVITYKVLRFNQQNQLSFRMMNKMSEFILVVELRSKSHIFTGITYLLN